MDSNTAGNRTFAGTDQQKDESQVWFDKFMREMHVVDVNNQLALFSNTGDARFFWRAFLLIHERGETIPSQMLDLIATWARELQTAQTPFEIAAALKLSGDAKDHIGPKQSKAYEHRWEVASEVAMLMKIYRAPVGKAIEKVATRRHMPARTVSKFYYAVFPKGIKQSAERPKRAGRSGSLPAIDQAMRSWR